MLRLIRPLGLALLLNASTSHAILVDLTDGVIGSLFSDQGFPGTEAVDIQLSAPVDFAVSSIKLREFTVFPGTGGTIGARIYESQTGSLLASRDAPVSEGASQSITIPIATTLRVGHIYRIGFVLDFGSATGIDVDPPGLPLTPFTERSGLIQIDGIFQGNADAFPTEPYPYLPFISLEVTQVPEPRLFAILGFGVLILALRQRSRAVNSS